MTLRLATNNGVLLVLNATTGAPVAVLADKGWLTSCRTAATGALITDALTPAGIQEVAVLASIFHAAAEIGSAAS
jgi:ornithine cyclodeaminase/alanine dehydrogenase-like protein (mu-crystallin family)